MSKSWYVLQGLEKHVVMMKRMQAMDSELSEF